VHETLEQSGGIEKSKLEEMLKGKVK
jgi:hypothetical protein